MKPSQHQGSGVIAAIAAKDGPCPHSSIFIIHHSSDSAAVAWSASSWEFTYIHGLQALLPLSYPFTHGPSQHAFIMSSSSNLQLVFDNALQAYEGQTKIYLFAHPLAARLQSCDSPGAILALLREQVRDGDDRWTRCLDPTVNVLDGLSIVLGERVNTVCLKTSTFTICISHQLRRLSHRQN